MLIGRLKRETAMMATRAVRKADASLLINTPESGPV